MLSLNNCLRQRRLIVLVVFSIPIVDAYQATREGQDLAEGDEHAMMNLSHRWGDKTAGEHYAPEDA